MMIMLGGGSSRGPMKRSPRCQRICAVADAIISSERTAVTVAIARILTIIPLLHKE
jgi:hypothetical protein